MDRTREFFLFAESTGAPQRKSKSTGSISATLISEIEEQVKEIETAVDLGKGVKEEKMRECENNLESLFLLQEEKQNPSEAEKRISASIRRKYAELSLKLAQARKKEKRAKVALEESLAQRKQQRPKGSQHESLYMPEKEHQITREETSTLRKREMEAIELHINELGRMVSEVSMHISMQGEKLERIDQLFTQSKTSIKKGSYELGHAWAVMSKRRKNILLLFGALFFLLFLKWYFR
ncbi:hypothetical protein NEFER03_1099 [Nematocida sp. LUAm3]|nr:hypothetical protein NEFER03_1099 [Nematocida sp. LUAm3]KAI5175296.1 hypothetical protein NEFER02_1225 [Nematocida sp. LUAm2]KAI5177747.1 hypothetical protein NEFER01_0971 [Nematocida sp. LUAm1]